MSGPDPVIQACLAELRERLAEYPSLHSTTDDWLNVVAERFERQGFFPIFTIPRWVQEGLLGHVEADIDKTTTGSTIAGYLYARLLDDIMDQQNMDVMPALPILGLLDHEFRKPYRSWFDRDHAFWDAFNKIWFLFLDATAKEASEKITSETDFETTAAMKLSAIKIPVVATCYRLDREDALADWLSFCDLYCQYHQFADDLADWHSDLTAGRSTWLLSEAERQGDEGESTGKWLLREGFSWSEGELGKRFDMLIRQAENLNAPSGVAHLRGFDEGHRQKLIELRPVLEKLASLTDLAARS